MALWRPHKQSKSGLGLVLVSLALPPMSEWLVLESHSFRLQSTLAILFDVLLNASHDTP